MKQENRQGADRLKETQGAGLMRQMQDRCVEGQREKQAREEHRRKNTEQQKTKSPETQSDTHKTTTEYTWIQFNYTSNTTTSLICNKQKTKKT